MSINGIEGAGGSFGAGPIRPSQAHEAIEGSNGGDQGASGRAASTGDRLEISAEARALSVADASPKSEAGQSSGLSAERIQGVLARVQGGFYDSPQVQEATAQGLLSDLRTL